MEQPTFSYAPSDALDLLRAVLKIKSVSGQEGKLAVYLTEFLRNHNFRILPSKVGNVIGMKGHGLPVLLLASHMDTVETQNHYKEESESIYATGAVDCKPSLASMVYAAAVTEWKDEYGTLIVAGLVQEETDDLGIIDFLNTDIHPDFAIFGEPTQNDRVCLGYRGRVWIQMDVKAEHGHTAASWAYENTIDVFYGLYRKMADMIADLNRTIGVNQTDNAQDWQHFHELSLVLSTIHAGQECNVIANKCAGDLDFRIPLWITPEELVRHLKKVIQQTYEERATTWKKPIHVDLKIKSRTNPCLVGSDIPLVQALRWAAFKETNHKITMIRKTGTTYTNNMMEYYCKTNPKFRCITYGPGDPKLEHTDHEQISKMEYLQTINTYLRFFPKFQEILKRGGSVLEPEITVSIGNAAARTKSNLLERKEVQVTGKSR